MSMRVRDTILIAAVGLVAIAIYIRAEMVLNPGQLGVPLDDAWIHFRFADNLAGGYGFSFNKGIPTPGATSPLWVLLLACTRFISPDLVINSKVLGVVFYLASGLAVYALAAKLGNRRHALLTAILTMISGRFVWAALSGMEVTLFAFLSLAAVWKHLDDREQGRLSLSSPILFGLASLARPEGYALFAFALLDRLIDMTHPMQDEQVEQDKSRIQPLTGRSLPVGSNFLVHNLFRAVNRQMIKPLLRDIALYLLLVTPYMAFSYQTTGRLLPNTYQVKARFFIPPGPAWVGQAATYLLAFCASMLEDNPLVALMLSFGIVVYVWRWWKERKEGTGNGLLPVLWLLGLPLLGSVIAPHWFHHHRYLMPLVPFVNLMALFGIDLFLSWPFRIRGMSGSPPPLVNRLLAAMAVTVGTILLIRWSGIYALDVANINEMHVAMGQWVKANTPPHSLIALHDIGAITFISDRPVIDLLGLATPEIIPVYQRGGSAKERNAAILAFLRSRRPDYIIIFPAWYPDLAKRFTAIHSIEVQHHSGITDQDTIVIYETHW